MEWSVDYSLSYWCNYFDMSRTSYRSMPIHKLWSCINCPREYILDKLEVMDNRQDKTRKLKNVSYTNDANVGAWYFTWPGTTFTSSHKQLCNKQVWCNWLGNHICANGICISIVTAVHYKARVESSKVWSPSGLIGVSCKHNLKTN